MLGLPEGIPTCLCDLDGVLTQPGKVHAAALAAPAPRWSSATSARFSGPHD